MNMALKVVGILFVISSARGLYLHESCKSDGDCTQPETYCYQSGQCVACTNCSLYNRLPGSGCAKDKNKCGNCLPGMESEDNLDGTFSCNPSGSGTLTPSTQAPNIEDSSYISITICIIVGVLVLVAVIIVCCILKNTDYNCVIIRSILKICPNNGFMSSGGNERTKCPETYQHQQPNVSQGPPPYEEANPSAPPFEDPPGGNRSPISQKVIRTVENDPSQTANAYTNPSYITGGRLGTNPEPEEEENEASEDDALINSSSISHPDDEETQPSTWTPTPGSETASTTGPTSFAGALSMDNLHITQPNPNVSFSVQHSNSHPNFNFNNPNPPETENASDGTTPQVNINVQVVNLIRSNVAK